MFLLLLLCLYLVSALLFYFLLIITLQHYYIEALFHYSLIPREDDRLDTSVLLGCSSRSRIYTVTSKSVNALSWFCRSFVSADACRRVSSARQSPQSSSDHPVAAECRDVQTCVQCPVKFTKLHVTPICRKRIQLTEPGVNSLSTSSFTLN